MSIVKGISRVSTGGSGRVLFLSLQIVQKAMAKVSDLMCQCLDKFEEYHENIS